VVFVVQKVEMRQNFSLNFRISYQFRTTNDCILAIESVVGNKTVPG